MKLIKKSVSNAIKHYGIDEKSFVDSPSGVYFLEGNWEILQNEV